MAAVEPEREALIPTDEGFNVSVATDGDDVDCVLLTVGDGETVTLNVSEFLAAQSYVRRSV